jgi:hypothetical protein
MKLFILFSLLLLCVTGAFGMEPSSESWSEEEPIILSESNEDEQGDIKESGSGPATENNIILGSEKD